MFRSAVGAALSAAIALTSSGIAFAQPAARAAGDGGGVAYRSKRLPNLAVRARRGASTIARLIGPELTDAGVSPSSSTTVRRRRIDRHRACRALAGGWLYAPLATARTIVINHWSQSAFDPVKDFTPMSHDDSAVVSGAPERACEIGEGMVAHANASGGRPIRFFR